MPRPKLPVRNDLPPRNPQGQHITEGTRKKIIKMMESGYYPNRSEIARLAGVSYSTIRKMLKSDESLRERYENALQNTADKIAEAAVNMCLDESQHPMARQKMIEFMLPKLDPEKYGENAGLLNNNGMGIKRVAIIATMPVADVDANGIPVAQSQSPLEVEAIESK